MKKIFSIIGLSLSLGFVSNNILAYKYTFKNQTGRKQRIQVVTQDPSDTAQHILNQPDWTGNKKTEKGVININNSACLSYLMIGKKKFTPKNIGVIKSRTSSVKKGRWDGCGDANFDLPSIGKIIKLPQRR